MRLFLGGLEDGVGWGPRRRRGPIDLFVTTVMFVFALLVSAVHHPQIDISVLERGSIVAILGALVVALIVWLVRRTRADRLAEQELLASSPTADVVALRFAVDASAAPKILRELASSARRPLAERLTAVTQRLLDAQLDHRLVGLETTHPLPETAAAELFFFWSDSARGRYTKTEDSKDGLVVVCLHVETSEEIPDLDPKDPKSVLATLETLRDHPRTVRRVDLWASRAPITESRLRELDPVLVPARG